MSTERFDKLESGAALPPDVKEALSRIARFDALEIGAPVARTPPPAASAPAAASAAPAEAEPADGNAACAHCGQINERQRETCWACFRFVAVKAAPPTATSPQDITLVLDGITYNSSDSDLPGDVGTLMERIRKHGYSQKLLADWREWRATRKVQPLRDRPFEAPASISINRDSVEVFKGQRTSVIRLDGKVYTSDDADLSPELKQLFAYIDKNGVTPALMEYLRQKGRVKVRPPTFAHPSDGDVEFWRAVNQPQSAEAAAAADELARAQARLQGARWRLWGTVGMLAFYILYILLISRL